MPDLSTNLKTRQQPAVDMPPADRMPLHMPPTVIDQRRRLVRWVATLTMLGGLGLSALPGPTDSHERTVSSTKAGVTTVVHEFTYDRTNGLPFKVVTTGIAADERAIRSVKVDGFGILGNVAVALAGAIALVALISRRRRDKLTT